MPVCVFCVLLILPICVYEPIGTYISSSATPLRPYNTFTFPPLIRHVSIRRSGVPYYRHCPSHLRKFRFKGCLPLIVQL